ncbi:MAG: hypothetical protein IPM82_31080 [Saprospiraceae bacterium]|nr:hypothetical protein [Saprospiraceae bacterium]
MKIQTKCTRFRGETFEYARQYMKQQGDYVRLEAAERISKTTSAMMTALVLGISPCWCSSFYRWQRPSGWPANWGHNTRKLSSSWQ